MLFSTEQRVFLGSMFGEYMKTGGIPEYVRTGNKEYLRSLYESIIYRDIIVRNRLPSERMIKELVKFTASNVGKEISFNSLKNMLGAGSATTVKEYFGYLEDSYIAFLLPRFDPSLKKQVYAGKKAYFIDCALANTVGFRPAEDRGRMLENAVFIELKRRGKEIYYYKGKRECDFLLREGIKITEAVQVSESLSGSSKEREIEGLLEALKAYGLKRGLILTRDESEEIEREGLKIRIMPVWEWMLGNETYPSD